MAGKCGTLLFASMVPLSLAMPALGADAQVTFTAPQRVILQGKQSGQDVFAAGGIEKECPKVSFEGTLSGDSPVLVLQPIYGEPIFSGCMAKILGGFRAKFVWNECSYILRPTGRERAKGRWTADVDIACPGESSLEWNVYENEKDFEAGVTACTTAMPSQTGLGRAELSNIAGPPGKLAIHWKLSDIEYRAYGSSLLCGPVLKSRQDAWYRGEATIAARAPGGQRVPLTVRGRPE